MIAKAIREYEKHIHPIPEGYTICFLDCDDQNTDLSNLAIEKKGTLISEKRLRSAYLLLIDRDIAMSVCCESQKELDRVRRIMREVEMKLIEIMQANGNIKK